MCPDSYVLAVTIFVRSLPLISFIEVLNHCVFAVLLSAVLDVSILIVMIAEQRSLSLDIPVVKRLVFV